MPDFFTTPVRFRQAINRFVPAFCLTFLSLSGSTLAAPWTVTATGTIQTGIDGLGLFGPAGSNLTGLFVTQSITLDPLLFHTQNNSDPNYVHSYGSLNGGTATVQVTVNGVSQTYAWDHLPVYSWGQTMLSNGVSRNTSGFRADTIWSSLQGWDSHRQGLTATIQLQSGIHAFNTSLNYSDTLEYSLPADRPTNSAYGDIYFSHGSTYFGSANGLDTILVNAPNNDIPEPGTLALLALGLAGLAYSRRKR